MVKPHGGRLIKRLLEGVDRGQALHRVKELPRLAISTETAIEVQNIAHGLFSPLEGFLNREDYQAVLREGRLSNGLPWTIPIVLDASQESRVKEGDEIALIYEGRPVALMYVEDVYPWDRQEMALKVFNTVDPAHPGVARVRQMKELLLGGKIDLLEEVNLPFPSHYLRPEETRALFAEKGWKTVVGFQTRNVPHRGHEYVQKVALSQADGLFLNPVIGRKRKGDFKDEVTLKAYEVLVENYYPRDRVILGILPLEMRYAGPREAIFHAILRKNFGCTHFIVGRDHAGVGNFYPPYAAQEIFREFPDLGITPVFFASVFHCRKCGGPADEKTCPHQEDMRLEFSGTTIRELFLQGKRPPKEVMREEVAEAIFNFDQPLIDEDEVGD